MSTSDISLQKTTSGGALVPIGASRRRVETQSVRVTCSKQPDPNSPTPGTLIKAVPRAQFQLTRVMLSLHVHTYSRASPIDKVPVLANKHNGFTIYLFILCSVAYLPTRPLSHSDCVSEAGNGCTYLHNGPCDPYAPRSRHIRWLLDEITCTCYTLLSDAVEMTLNPLPFPGDARTVWFADVAS